MLQRLPHIRHVCCLPGAAACPEVNLLAAATARLQQLEACQWWFAAFAATLLSLLLLLLLFCMAV
jgi:hypothetical protein